MTDLDVVDSILPIGSAPEGNNNGVLPPGHKALGAGQRVPDQLQVPQVVQLHCCIFGGLKLCPALQLTHRTIWPFLCAGLHFDPPPPPPLPPHSHFNWHHAVRKSAGERVYTRLGYTSSTRVWRCTAQHAANTMSSVTMFLQVWATQLLQYTSALMFQCSSLNILYHSLSRCEALSSFLKVVRYRADKLPQHRQ